MHGTATTLSAAAGGSTSVLVFYRGAWCPYCNIALSADQEQLLPELTRRGVQLVAVSPQKPDGSLTMQQKTTSPSPSSLTRATPSPAASASSQGPRRRPGPPSSGSDST